MGHDIYLYLRYSGLGVASMENFLLLQTTAGAAVFALFLYSLSLMSKKFPRNVSKKRAAPEAGGAWPVIGHLHLLGGTKPAHRVLGNMADRCGPIFTIKLGQRQALVVSSWEFAKECFTANDKVFANRPKTIAMEILGYNCSMIGFSPYGTYWRHVRKIGTLELLSNRRLQQFKPVREIEVKTSIKELYELWLQNKSTSSTSNKVLVEMKRWIGDITLNFILRIVVGKRLNPEAGEVNNRWKVTLNKFSESSGKFMISDALPFLRRLDIGGEERLMKKIAKDLDDVVEEWLEEHKMKRISSEMIKEEEDFMDLMLSILDDADTFAGRDAHTITKATCLALILAATDTSAITLTWALSLLLNNRDVLKNAQNELDIQVGKERQVRDSDIKNLPYLQAILKETMRLYPAAALSLPHESMEDCALGHYDVPAGTQLIVNLWKIHRDPRIWSDPCKFQPERFLTTHKDFDVRGQNFEYMPFGSGRRMCPGVSFALQVLQLTLAGLLHGFDFASPSDESVDMTEGIGLTLFKTAPLEVLLSPRLSASLYG